ncbi:MAG: 30S ribosomal protein S6 [Elusimicrobia bacterium]|nr:30S ribosomal protein S6 [Elusimicrobiota bacterium]
MNIMKTYELMIILDPQVSDSEVEGFIEKTKKIITGEKAEILSEDKLGRKKLTHQIGRNRDGFYIYLKLSAPPGSVKAINHTLKLQQAVLRTMILKTCAELVKKV